MELGSSKRIVTKDPFGSLAISRNFSDDALAETHVNVEITGGEFVVVVGPGVVVVAAGADVVAWVVEGVFVPVVTDETAVVVDVAGVMLEPEVD